MKYFVDNIKGFEKEMYKVKEILLRQGFVLESDHPYAYAMQYIDAFNDVKNWLLDNGYDGNLEYAGTYEGVAVYCLYDSCIISYDDMKEKLIEEARRQYSTEMSDR